MSLFEKIGRLFALNAPMSLEKRLVEAESEIGGRLVPKLANVRRQRFWYYDGYWHYEQQFAGGVTSVVSYQFTELQAYKLFNGKEVEMTPDELANVLEMISRYHAQVKSELYLKRRSHATA